MHLKRLYLHGFKSFAGVTKLDFEPGISAIVGPNGSGKSNIADAIRWALGEQSTRNLRLKKNDEVIFAGTEKRAKASLAEVRLLFDNSAGKLPIDASEIEISRLLYRNGETEYRLNGKKAPLREIQQILGEAGFGANSYSVIGQGTIDSFILASPSERKLLFDEASGIRVYELSRQSALKKLEATETNMVRIRDILAELAPQLNSLAQVAELAQLQIKHREALDLARRKYYGTALSLNKQRTLHTGEALNTANMQFAVAEAMLGDLKNQQTAYSESEQAHSHEQKQAAAGLLQLEMKRDGLANDLSVKRAEYQYMLDEHEKLVSDVGRSTELLDRQRQLEQEFYKLQSKLEKSRHSEDQATVSLETVTAKISEAQIRLNELRHDNLESSQREYVQHALGILRQIALDLRSNAAPMVREQFRLMVHKAGRLLSLASGKDATLSIAEIREAQTHLSTLMAERETMHDHYTDIVIGVRSVELDMAANRKLVAELAVEAEVLVRDTSKRQTQLEEGIAGRKKHLEQLEREAVDIKLQLDSRRDLQRSRPTETKQIFELARSLEATLSECGAMQQQIQELEMRLKAEHNTAASLLSEAKALGIKPEQFMISGSELWPLEREIIALAAKLEDAPVSVSESTAQYQEVTDRFDFLSGQLGDLEKASAGLTEAIGSFEALIKQRFEEAFGDIAKHFNIYFQKLFNGGKANLTYKDDDGQFGIEIVAIPPGKRVESLSVLSGGERSLVGIALLAAILTVNPSPFVVLDEVDAALDEANSSRFADILATIGGAQFLVITHNRQTMRAAHSLFGVSMDDQHVSSLLSMRLEAAEQLASVKVD